MDASIVKPRWSEYGACYCAQASTVIASHAHSILVLLLGNT